MLNKYNDNFNKTSSTKTNSHNNSYKNKNREMIKNNNSIKNKKIKAQRNKYEETLNINQFTENQLINPSSYEFQNSHEEENINLNINTDISIRGGSYKTGKTNKNIFIEENSNQNVKKIFLYKNKRNQLSNKNDKKVDYLNKINNEKIIKGKNIFENPADMKKTKLLIIHKSDNKKNKVSNKTSVKKEKSLDNQPFLNLSNRLLNNKILSKKIKILLF